MEFTYLAPSWFFGWDVVLELVYAVILLVVAIFAFKIYKKSNQDSVKLMSLSFAFISFSYFVQSIFNYLIITKSNAQVCRAVKIQSVALFDTYGIFIHIFFMTIGLVILTFMSLKAEKKRVFWLMLLLSLSGIFLSKSPVYVFFLLSSIFLIFISIHFIFNYLKNKKVTTLLVAVAFLFLLFGSFHFLIAVNHQLFYVIGHFLELIAYLLILANLLFVLKK